MRRSQIYRKPHRFKRKKPIFRNRFFWLGILTAAIVGAIFYLLFFSEFFQVKKINISGLEKIQKESIQPMVEQRLENGLLFFRTKSIFLVNPAAIQKQLFYNFPQIAELKVNRQFPETVNIFAKERKEGALWCQQEKCYSLDKEGIIFKENQQAENIIPESQRRVEKSEALRFSINDEKNTKTFSLGEKVIEKNELDNIFKIQTNLKNQKIEANNFTLLSDRLTVKTAEGWEIYFNLSGDIDWQLTKLGAVLEEKIPFEKRKDLEYIELRFGNLAPFKYRNNLQ
ncbi:MAG: FtsQ-type POTRA domain-containing protein [bacterium]|nr:FtsQ-type POTRA domain-containing protein [bacterium]